MTIKYQVFISSTFVDLRDEREQVIRAVLEMGHIPVGMEMFSAADDEQWSIITRQIDEADYYALLLAHRYGSTTPTGIGYTEKEYDYAVSKGIPVLGFVLDDKAPWPAHQMEAEEDKRLRLEQFRAKAKGRMVNFWESKNDLHAKFSIALMKAFITNPRTGWTRASEVAGPEVIKELTRLSAENGILRKDIEALELKEREQDKDAHREVLRTLQKNAVVLHVRKTASDWGDPIDSTLLDIFEAVAVKLLVENSPSEMARDVALGILNATDYHYDWPVPDNYLREWIVDLHALDLIEPSKRKHSVSDKEEYWSLTDFGREAFKDFRKYRLEQAKPRATEQPAAPSAG